MAIINFYSAIIILLGNAELLKFFSKCKEGKTRMIKVHIENEESLSLATHKEGKKDWKNDWDKCILTEVEPEKPCFMLYKIELKVPEFIFISYIPDNANTRQKMIYSSTKAALKVSPHISSCVSILMKIPISRPSLEAPTLKKTIMPRKSMKCRWTAT